KVMRARQQELADNGDVVIEGRDIGTVVAPQAAVKVYLNADRSVRANRRLAERPEIGADVLATDLRLRDQSDAARMRPAEDAIQIDTTELDVEDVVSQIEELVRARQPAEGSVQLRALQGTRAGNLVQLEMEVFRSSLTSPFVSGSAQAGRRSRAFARR